MTSQQPVSRVHFIGVGGVGMSGIARIAAAFGMNVSGSDLEESGYTDQLIAAGVKVIIGQRAENITDDIEVVVISTAIPQSNVELVEARRKGITVWHRSQMLAALGIGRKTLAAAGTHGKTTSSSMMATAFDALGVEPTFVVGGIVDKYATSAMPGTGEYYVVEADESDGSFLNLSPYVALITNIEADHLDHYPGGLQQIYDTFEKFMASVPDDGACVVCGEDHGASLVADRLDRRVVRYGFGEGFDIRIADYRTEGITSLFNVTFPDGVSVDVRLGSNPGRHNVLNAAGVLGVVWVLGHDVAKAAAGLSDFQGVHRRFEQVGTAAGVTVVDDYAHHPTEIAATTRAASSLGFGRVLVAFQPHRYSRTIAQMDQYSAAFDAVDRLFLLDVFAAGEAPIPGADSQSVMASIRSHEGAPQVECVGGIDGAVEALAQLVQPGDLVITMGAGSITKVGPALLARLGRE